MKKLIYLLMVALLLTACSDDGELKEIIPVSSNDEDQSDSTDLEKANEKFKSESVEHSFIELNSDEIEKMTKVKLSGTAKFVQGVGTNQTFKLSTVEGDGFGIYSIKNLSGVDITEGTEVTVYGSYNGKSELSEPEIMAIVIE